MLKIKDCKKIMKKCSQCGKLKIILDFPKRKNGKDGTRPMCKRCFRKHLKEYKKVCVICGNEFITRNKNKKCCSEVCTSKYKSYISSFEKNPNYKGRTKMYKCEYCGKEFKGNNYKNSKRHYCSQKCKSKHQKEILIGKNNPNFGNTGSKNPLWNPERTDEERSGIRAIPGYKKFVCDVIKRDNYTCQCCGKKIRGDGKIHHLDGYNWCKEKRTDINNGITLCNNCHENFHKIYGRGNNTKEQYIEFKNNFDNHVNTEVSE